MPKAGKRARDEAEGYDSDGGFVSNDDAPKKKSKKLQAQSTASTESEKGFWELSSGRNPRRVAISSFKDVHLINIREFYEKNEEYLPGKKGISLTVEQYQAFLKAIPEINSALQNIGIDVSSETKDDGEAMDEDVKRSRKKAQAKRGKANIEATSDEEE